MLAVEVASKLNACVCVCVLVRVCTHVGDLLFCVQKKQNLLLNSTGKVLHYPCEKSTFNLTVISFCKVPSFNSTICSFSYHTTVCHHIAQTHLTASLYDLAASNEVSLF